LFVNYKLAISEEFNQVTNSVLKKIKRFWNKL
jgi:hypothetical protein